ncbi:IGR protein motif-domain-containing protein [Syncephalastrum racemosum]|uniref:Small ribosomal subunit protein mS41 n=1 Tax=Syncephalastrum racemosum TaxID=13706 RepID=A0A1X2H0W7_SYNRA|nr:IGR protein motif-domain-containing protein [Syncephalastrum racemosum]
MFNRAIPRGVRFAHTAAVQASKPVPPPRGSIKEPVDFLKAIGRNCEQHAESFETWDSLFTSTSRVMRNDMGIETKQRKYILAWREFYRQGRDLHAVPLKSPKKKK